MSMPHGAGEHLNCGFSLFLMIFVYVAVCGQWLSYWTVQVFDAPPVVGQSLRQWGQFGETALCRYLAVRSVKKEGKTQK